MPLCVAHPSSSVAHKHAAFRYSEKRKKILNSDIIHAVLWPRYRLDDLSYPGLGSTVWFYSHGFISHSLTLNLSGNMSWLVQMVSLVHAEQHVILELQMYFD